MTGQKFKHNLPTGRSKYSYDSSHKNEMDGQSNYPGSWYAAYNNYHAVGIRNHHTAYKYKGQRKYVIHSYANVRVGAWLLSVMM